MLETDKSWIASAIDAEGSITTTKKGIVRITLGTRSEEYTKRVCDLIRGRMHVTHYETQKELVTFYHAQQNSKMIVREVLMDILQYLVIKQKKAQEALDFIASHPHYASSGVSVRLQHSPPQPRVNCNGGLESSHVPRPRRPHDPEQRIIRHWHNPLPHPKPRASHNNPLPERLTLATIILIATPITRVFISILTFAANRNLKYVAVTVIVFLILISSMLLGYLGHFTPE
ncbi:MAG: DUF1634 domain-containing protein [Candidatus Bathyarchaeia archaeon]|jgi:hypothetical protein